MVAQIASPYEFRRPGCDERCRTIVALLPGVLRRTELLLHDADAHEEYGFSEAGGFVHVVETGPLVVDLTRLEVTVDGRLVRLTPTEIRLLGILAQRAGRVVEGERLLAEVWSGARAMKLDGHLLRVNMSRVRQKLKAAGALVTTIAGIGYRLEMAPPRAPSPAQPSMIRVARKKGWSQEHLQCRGCGTTKRRHRARGYCGPCYTFRHDRGMFEEEPE